MIPQTGTWSAAWTRAHLLGHIPAIWDDRIYFVDKPCENGRQRDWFIEIWLDQKIQRFWLSSQSFQTSGTSVTLSSLSPAWNNSANSVEGIGGGGSGGAGKRNSSGFAACTGGGGGEYRKISNFADPGGATPMTIGQGGTAAATGTGSAQEFVAGNNGTSTTWNTNSLIATLGNGGGAASGTSPLNGGAGGTGGTGSAGNNNGGAGGQGTPSGTSIATTGGGGAGGPNGAGNAGVAGGNASNTNGGQGDGASGGTGGTGGTTTPAGNGNPGTELGDSIHGCGGGGGAIRQALNGAIVAGSGGLYGAAGGGAYNIGAGNNSSDKATSGAGANGIIVLTWTPSTFSGGKLIEVLQAVQRGSFW